MGSDPCSKHCSYNFMLNGLWIKKKTEISLGALQEVKIRGRRQVLKPYPRACVQKLFLNTSYTIGAFFSEAKIVAVERIKKG